MLTNGNTWHVNAGRETNGSFTLLGIVRNLPFVGYPLGKGLILLLLMILSPNAIFNYGNQSNSVRDLPTG